ncbi:MULTISPECIES: methionyl-tRNA formyltransferase [Calothrix]|uniref:Formyl transferase N-terminal domain-containing protein n=2 Tax=Calothrix TaxID=1186 RepID=A0ABR8ACI9_9CYAN|nr:MULTISPECIES: formyltransferase family protein [Calothrix]MBD2197613.1 hypothetical protein [Calothrix parietina FACHB-288]MBD2227431.1 hypothetical protein [Calothrix anomala FACHB-343]
MKICIAGQNDIAVKSTSFLISEKIVLPEDLIVCFNQADTGKDLFQKSFKKYSQEHNLVNAKLEDLYNINNLLFISLQYDKIIFPEKFKSNLLFNIHFSLLPKYKGMYTSVWPILNGDQYSGVTLHTIDAGIDTGEIIDQIKFDINFHDTSRDLYLKYIEHGIYLFKKNIYDLVSGHYKTVQQSAIESSYYSKCSINFSNISINLNKSAFEIRNQIRAFNFKEYQIPVIYGFKIVSANILDSITRKKPGTILYSTQDYIDISTIDYDLRLNKEKL